MRVVLSSPSVVTSFAFKKRGLFRKLRVSTFAERVTGANAKRAQRVTRE
jgi:hypothetical protein